MIIRYTAILFLLSFYCTSLLAQKYNRTDDSGNRVGYWVIKGEDDKLLAKGRYNDQGEREGEWKFYMSPIGRYTSNPDVKGSYENGVKHGRWELRDSRSKITMKGKYNLGVMEGIWIVYDNDGHKMAAGRYQDGIRNGNWLLFKDDQVMGKGRYANGEKVGEWTYDYYVERGGVHIKGSFDYDVNNGKGVMEYYKVERHPKFGTEELLVGTGTYLNGLKSGKWIEYSRGLKGELIATGFYDGEGLRNGIWTTTLNNKPYREEAYNDGKRQGTFKGYYDDGTLRYTTYYDNGMELGSFKSYFPNGKVKEEGSHTILEDVVSEDTVYYKIKLPYEYKLKLIEEDYEHLNYNAIDWLDKPDPSVAADELEARWQEFLSYGKSKNYRIKEIVRKDKMTVRVGKYVLYYANSKVALEGKHYPKKVYAFNPSTGRREIGFARDGEWKEYDEAGYLRYTYYYNEGELTKMEDSKGREVDPMNLNAIID